jgi:hypothetical protein
VTAVNGQTGELCDECGEAPAEFDVDDRRLCGWCLITEADATEQFRSDS